MVDIFNIPFYYIGFNRNSKLEYDLSEIGFKNVNHFPSVDGKKMDRENLLKDGIISIRAYNDLKYGRHQHTAISSLGSIGCALSHIKLWELCSDKYPYMIIVEDDIKLHKLTENNIKDIQSSIVKDNGMFISSNVIEDSETLFNLHFYVISNKAAQQMLHKALPINLQVDSYIGHLSNIGDINLEGYEIFEQNKRKSSTQDNCIKCILPSNKNFYIGVGVGIIILIILLIITKIITSL
jgi:GR25 family glycosyltransferase involved in LPS biosynthesis